MLGIFAWQNFISLSLNVTISFKITKLGVFDASLPCSLLLVCNKCSLLILKKKTQSIHNRIALGLTLPK